MHIYFSGIGGTGLGPLALIAQQAGYTVSGSDKQDSEYIHYLYKHGITNIHIGQTTEQIEAIHSTTPIDWIVYTTAVTSEQANPPELTFAAQHSIRISRRDELLNYILDDKQLAMIAIAGTHGKSTTTAMTIWLLQQLGIAASHSVGAKMSYADMGHYEPGSKYFVYEADEYARNFLSYHPALSLITGIDWDHPDIYPTNEIYNQAFQEFTNQSSRIVAWQDDVDHAGLQNGPERLYLAPDDTLLAKSTLLGSVNRRNAVLVAYGIAPLCGKTPEELVDILQGFPGLSRRFEQLAQGLYTDYAHTPPKIAGAIQTAHEQAGDRVVVVYEGLHNTRQHFIKAELVHLFDSVLQLYIVPSYLAREDPTLPLLNPADLRGLLSEATQAKTIPSTLDAELWKAIQSHRAAGDLVLCLSAGGGGSLDEWLRQNLAASSDEPTSSEHSQLPPQ